MKAELKGLAEGAPTCAICEHFSAFEGKCVHREKKPEHGNGKLDDYCVFFARKSYFLIDTTKD
jgi:hypothetical protein